MTLFDLIRRARDLIAEPGTWTQDALARTEQRERCDHRSTEAHAFSLFGAIDRAGGRHAPVTTPRMCRLEYDLKFWSVVGVLLVLMLLCP